MDNNLLLARLLAGRVPCLIANKKYYIGRITNFQLLNIQEVYEEVYENALSHDILTSDDLLKYMYDQGLWTTQEQEELDLLPNKLENSKLEYYNSYLNFKKRDALKKHILETKNRLYLLLGKRHRFDHITCEGVATHSREIHFIGCATRNNRDELVWPNFSFLQIPQSLLSTLLHIYTDSLLDEESIRLFVRSNLWRAHWSIRKELIFTTDCIYSEEQKHVLSWSRVYDSVYESTDCPPEDVLNDDDMLDGWLICQQRKRAASDEERRKEVVGSKYGAANEVFIMAGSHEDAKRIDGLNSTNAKIVKKQRMDLLQKKGSVSEEQFLDSKIQIAQQAMQQFKDQLRSQ